MAAPPLAPAGPGPFAALVDSPAYRRYYLGQGISLIGTWLQGAAVGWIVFDLTRSERWLGAVEAIAGLPILLVGVPAGAVADRVSPRPLILAMQAAQMLSAGALAMLVGLGGVRAWQLATMLAIARTCWCFEMPSRQVFLYRLLGRGALPNAIALNSGLFNLSRVVGPALAGLCLARLGRTACFALNAASYLAAIAAMLSIRPAAVAVVLGGGPAGGGVLGGLAYLRRDRRSAALFGVMVLFGIAVMGYAAMLPAYARRVVGTGAIGYGLMMTAGGLGATLGAVVVASLGDLGRRERLIPIGLALVAASLGAGGLLPGGLAPGLALPAAAACLAGAGFGAILINTTGQTIVQLAVPDGLRGRVMGLWVVAYTASIPLGALWAGEVASRAGVPFVMRTCAAFCLAIALGLGAAGGLAGARRASG